MTAKVWVNCPNGRGYIHDNGTVAKRIQTFRPNSVGLSDMLSTDGKVKVWLIGPDETWDIAADEIEPVDIFKTGDKFSHKICNVCHRLLTVDSFDINQNNLHGAVRRPSCQRCRSDIDKRAPKSRQAKDAEKERPARGSSFRCPICRKRSIVGVTAKVVADHDHHTGNIRDFICDSCNTGLGRFKNGIDCLANALEYIKHHEVTQ